MRHRGGGDPSREHEAFGPERLVQIVTPDAASPLAGVNHHAAAFVYADVRHERSFGVAREEQEIRALPPPADATADPRPIDRAPRQLDARLQRRTPTALVTGWPSLRGDAVPAPKDTPRGQRCLASRLIVPRRRPRPSVLRFP